MKYEVRQLKGIIKEAINEREELEIEKNKNIIAVIFDVCIMVLVPAFWLMTFLILLQGIGESLPSSTADGKSIFVVFVYVWTAILWQQCRYDFKKREKWLKFNLS